MQGLSSHQVEVLLKQYGLNAIVEKQRETLFSIFVQQFNNFLIILLLAGSGISFAIGKPFDGFLIIAIVFLNACFGVYQEKKASDAIAALKTMTVTKVRVVRDGKEGEIDSTMLVPGDTVYLEEGSKIPADGIVEHSVVLEVNESALTGESLPVAKRIRDRLAMGTIVAKGRARMKVTATGMSTRFGSIAQQLMTIKESKTPLQKKLERLSKIVGIVGIMIAGIVFALSFLTGSGYFPSFLLAVSLVVAVAPEGLPAVMTITMAVGVKEMAKKRAIVRKLAAIETLGSITLIATDKTGTLTENSMRVKEVFVDNRVHDENNLDTLHSGAFDKLLLNGILCSTASLVYIHDHGAGDVLGDPTEASLLFLAEKLGVRWDELRREWNTLSEQPFDNVTKKMIVTVEHDEKKYTFVKGALESVLRESESILILGKKEKFSLKEKQEVMAVADRWAEKGLRVMAFAYSTTDSMSDDRSQMTDPRSQISDNTSDIRHLTSDIKSWTFLGMVAIYDPPRPEVAEAIEKARKAGIDVVMITGDNEKTAEAIGKKIGLLKENEEILTGQQIDSYDDNSIIEKLTNVRIFARTNPFQKARIVGLYQKKGEIVAVTGDGVNDAIALKQADIGVAMGKIGTDVARETADMVITDDNFATIVNAVEEGRLIVRNLKNAIKYLLTGNSSEALSLLGGLVLGIPALFYPLQILYINLITDGVPALALAFSPREGKIMTQPPDRRLSLLQGIDKLYIVAVALLSAGIILSSYFLFQSAGELFARTAAFSVLAVIQSFIFVDIWLSHRSIYRSVKHVKSKLFMFAFGLPIFLQLIIVSFTPLATIFKIITVPFITYVQFVIMAMLIMIAISLVKKVIHNYRL